MGLEETLATVDWFFACWCVAIGAAFVWLMYIGREQWKPDYILLFRAGGVLTLMFFWMAWSVHSYAMEYVSKRIFLLALTLLCNIKIEVAWDD